MTKYEFPDDMRKRISEDLERYASDLLDPEMTISVAIRQPSMSTTSLKFMAHDESLNDWIRAWGHEKSEYEIRTGTALMSQFRSARPPRSITFTSMGQLSAFLGQSGTVPMLKLVAVNDAIKAISSNIRLTASILKALNRMQDGDLSTLCRYFEWRLKNPDYSDNIRTVPVPGMHSKFLEDNSKVVLSISSQIGLVKSDTGKLAERLGYDRTQRQTLWVKACSNEHVSPYIKSNEFAVRPADLNKVDIKRILVVENLHNFEEGNPTPGTLLIFGSGKEAASLLRQVSWLNEVDVYYFGDCDSYGFQILAGVRAVAPHTKSVLMDIDTINANRSSAVEEPASSQVKFDTLNLSTAECATLSRLKVCAEKPLRLEQEKIEGRLDKLAELGLHL